MTDTLNRPSPQQLSLGVCLNDDATFDNFYSPQLSHNAMVVADLRQLLTASGEQFIYLWGAPGCGLTHLLQAACHEAQTQGLSMQYLPLRELVGYAPEELFSGLETLDLVCLDCLPSIAGRPEWESAIFSLFNRLRDANKKLLVAAEQGLTSTCVNLDAVRIHEKELLTRYEQVRLDIQTQALRRRYQIDDMRRQIRVTEARLAFDGQVLADRDGTVLDLQVIQGQTVATGQRLFDVAELAGLQAVDVALLAVVVDARLGVRQRLEVLYRPAVHHVAHGELHDLARLGARDVVDLQHLRRHVGQPWHGLILLG